MHILSFFSLILGLSAPMHESRMATFILAAVGGITVRPVAETPLIRWDVEPSAADTSGDSSQRGRSQKEEADPAERKARQSRTFGILALGTIGLGLLLPVLFAGAIPLGILAIVKGTQAMKEGYRGRDGRVMGIVALSLLLLGLVMVIGFLATPGFF